MSDNRNSPENLQRFAIRIEQKLAKRGGSSTIENLICRALTNRKHAAFMLPKWVEWRYGKPDQRLEVSGKIEHEVKIEDVKARVSELLDRRGRAGIIEIASPRAAADEPKQISDVLSGNGAIETRAIQKAS